MPSRWRSIRRSVAAISRRRLAFATATCANSRRSCASRRRRRGRRAGAGRGAAGALLRAVAATPSAAASTGKPAAPGRPVAKPAEGFTAQVAPILARHCGSCHIAGRKGGFQMTSYAGLMKTGMVQPGAGEASRLVETILSGDMPRGGGKVSPDEVGVLIRWINAGAAFDGPDPTVPLDGLARASTAATQAPPPAAVQAVKLKNGAIQRSMAWVIWCKAVCALRRASDLGAMVYRRSLSTSK